MLTSFRRLAATATLVLPTLALAMPASAQTTLPADEVEESDASPGPFTFSANAALVSEYRFRGVDLSGGDFAVQGGLDLSHESGFYVGTWASTIDDATVGFGDVELDLYGGWSGDMSDGLAADVGVIAYLYPDAGSGDFDYIELYGSLTFALGPAEAKIGGAYAPKQDSLGGTDNIYVYTDIGIGIPDTPLTVTAHLGYTDGFLTFTNDGNAFDWSIGADYAVSDNVSVGVSYVGAEGDIPVNAYDFVDDAIVGTFSLSF